MQSNADRDRHTDKQTDRHIVRHRQKDRQTAWPADTKQTSLYSTMVVQKGHSIYYINIIIIMPALPCCRDKLVRILDLQLEAYCCTQIPRIR